MCFGSGAPKYEKPDFGPLPSTSVSKKDRKVPALKDVEKTRTGQAPRSLLNPSMGQDYGS